MTILDALDWLSRGCPDGVPVNWLWMVFREHPQQGFESFARRLQCEDEVTWGYDGLVRRRAR